jgi:hypothetical protein
VTGGRGVGKVQRNEKKLQSEKHYENYGIMVKFSDVPFSPQI